MWTDRWTDRKGYGRTDARKNGRTDERMVHGSNAEAQYNEKDPISRDIISKSTDVDSDTADFL